MGLNPQFTKADIKSYIDNKIRSYRAAILNRLQQAGEKFVILARNGGGYIDQTGNLRSSIGYLVLYNGSLLFEAFPGDKTEGKQKGLDLANKEYSTKGYCLICVAGMDYAAAVESKGKDVITGSSQIIEGWLKNALSGLKNKL